LRQFRYDYGKELTVAFSGLVLLALFFYVFGDFFTNKIQALSPAFIAVILTVTHGLLCVLLALTLFFTSQHPLHRHSEFVTWGQRIGVAPAQLKNLSFWHSFSRYLNAAFPWLLFDVTILLPRLQQPLFGLLALVVLATLAIILGQKITWTHQREARPSHKLLHKMLTRSRNAYTGFLRWKLLQTLTRNRTARLAAGMALAHLAFVIVLHIAKAPPLAIEAFMLLLSFWLVVPLALNLQEDLRTSWLDKMFGVDHLNFQQAYSRNAMLLVVVAGIPIVLVSPLLGLPLPDLARTVVQELGIMASMPLLFPALMFHVDGRRVFITLATTFLLALFVSTAIMAHPAAVILFWIVIPFFKDAQKGRYFRA
jgi:hypothetical protein